MSFTAAGQNIASLKSRMSDPIIPSEAVAKVTEHGSAASITARYDAQPKPATVQGYRIRIFFDNGQNARSQASTTEARFNNEFPGIPTYLVYENPSFMVTVGNYVTIDEALILWERVRKSFGTAFLWRGDIPVDQIIRQPLPAATDSSEEEQNYIGISTT